MNRRFLGVRVLHKSWLRMHAFSFFSPIIRPRSHIETCNFSPRQKNVVGHVMKFTPKHFMYVDFPSSSSSSVLVTKIKYSQCFQMTSATNLCDLLYTGGSYIDDCRFPSCPRPKNKRNRSNIISHPTFSNPLEGQDCKRNLSRTCTSHYLLLYQPHHPAQPH